MWRDFRLALSFANLVYLRAWADLLPLSADHAYYRKTLPDINLYFAVAGDVLALSLLTWLAIHFAPKLPGWLQRGLVAAGLGMVTLALGSLAPNDWKPGLFHVLLAAFWVVAAGLCFWFFPRALRVANWAAMAATPCLAVTFLGSLVYLQIQSPLPANPPLARRLAGSPATRVIWLVFDEWDQRLTFNERAAETRLPVLDSLAARSFTATHAVAVQSGIPVPEMATTDAIPSMLYGVPLARSGIADASSRFIVFDGGKSTVFGAGNSLFARVHSQGWNVAAAGWYLPYCRVFGSQLSDCYWDVMYEQRSSPSPTFPQAAIDETRMLFETQMLSVFGPSLVNLRHQAEYEALLAAAERYAADPSIGLAFVHFNVPHVPYFYDPKVGRLGHYGYSEALYNRALEWVDSSVGEILSTLHRSGLDSKTAIILTSDHPLRNATPDPYVPFIVHLPNETAGMTFTQEFSTLRTVDLALGITSGGVKSVSDVMAALGIR